MRGETTHFKEKFPTMWDEVIRKYRYWFTPEGKEYWKNIALLRHIINNYPNWHNHRDILHRWGVRDFTPPSYVVKAPLKPLIQKAYVENRERAINAEEVFARALDVPNPAQERVRRRNIADTTIADATIIPRRRPVTPLDQQQIDHWVQALQATDNPVVRENLITALERLGVTVEVQTPTGTPIYETNTTNPRLDFNFDQMFRNPHIPDPPRDDE